MEIITDLKYIKEMSRKREEENWEFRAFLKQTEMAAKEMDAIVHQITEKVTSQIDCTQCANCCKQISPLLDKDDISKFAAGLKITAREFQEQYLRKDTEEPEKQIFNKLPCPFLEDDRCSNYDFRPQDCLSYPHLYKKGFVRRLWGVVESYAICPIVFNVYEQLKIRLWHRRQLHEDDFDWG
jgi:Fe-S-cluster containining protein